MPPKIDLTGKRFGRLVALKDSGRREKNSGGVLWECQCDCGNIVLVSRGNLRSGHTTSCGCYGRRDNQKRYIKDLTGQKFGKLLVIEQTDKRSYRNVIFKCQCDCGNIIEVPSSRLIQGKTTSCGCLSISHGEQAVLNFLQENNIKYLQQKTFQNCKNPKTNVLLKFDFYLPDYNCCIEYDGEQHFMPRNNGFFTEDKVKEIQYRDSIKNQYCKDNEI